MINLDTTKKCITSVLTEDYFPLIVSANDCINDIRYVEITSGRNNLLEFTVNKYTGEFYRMKLILCEKFLLQGSDISIPSDYIEGTLAFDNTLQYSVDSFEVIVYQNGIQMLFNQVEAATYFRSGNIILGLDSLHNPTCVIIVDLSPYEIKNVLGELALSSKETY